MRVPRHPHVRSSEILRYPCRRTDKAVIGTSTKETGGRGSKETKRASFHLGTKQVTHAQSPYITVEACKLFNCLAYPRFCTRAAAATLRATTRSLPTPIFLPSFLPSTCATPFHHLIPFDRPTGAGPQIIEAQLKRGKTWTWAKRISSSSFRLLFLSDPPFYIPPRLTRYPLGTRSIPPPYLSVPFSFR